MIVRNALALGLLLSLLSCSDGGGDAAAESVHLPFPAETRTAGTAEQVVLISVDGLRPDAIDAAPAKTLQGLLRRGSFCPEAETIATSETLPAHASMFSGLDSPRHEVTWNDARPGTMRHPTIFSAAADAGLSTAMLFAKDKFHYFVRPGSVHWTFGPRRGTGRMLSAGAMAKAFRDEWPQRRYRLTFVHLADADTAGHGSGWMSPHYLEAVRQADAAIGEMLDVIRSSGSSGRTALLITADHGGHGRGHYWREGRSLENLAIPWIGAGAGVKSAGALDVAVKITDTAPTVLALLGVPALSGVDGRVVQELFR